MKIIHIVLGKANPERMNGVNKVAYNLATTQKWLGYDVVLWGITPNPVKNYPDRAFETVLFQSQKNPFAVGADLRKAIAETPAGAVLHLHGAFIPVFFKISQLAQRQQIAYIYTAHGALGAAAMGRNNFVKQLYFRVIERRILKSAKAVHLLGKTEADHVYRLLPSAQNIVVLPNGQDLAAIPAVSVDKSSRIAPIFGFLGRMDAHHKGLDLLLDGFAQYRKTGGTGTLQLIGGGADLENLQALASRLGIGESVVFHGAKYGDEKFEMTAQFDVFLHPSRMEGFPTAVLEAAALGLPCMTSEETNINDYIRAFNAGYAYTNNTSEGICEQLYLILRDFKANLLQQKGKNAQNMVESEFSWESVAKKLVEVYSKKFFY